MYLVPIEARSHRGTRKIVRYCHIYHSHDHKLSLQVSKVFCFDEKFHQIFKFFNKFFGKFLKILCNFFDISLQFFDNISSSSTQVLILRLDLQLMTQTSPQNRTQLLKFKANSFTTRSKKEKPRAG